MPFGAKLGLQRSPGSFTPLHLVHPGGGLVPQTVLLVQRRHPPLLWQRTAEGRAATRSPQAHAAALDAATARLAQASPCALRSTVPDCTARDVACMHRSSEACRGSVH